MTFALVRKNQVVKTCLSAADAQAARLADTDVVLPLVDADQTEGDVLKSDGAASYVIEADRVVRILPVHALSKEELGERFRSARASAYPPIGDQLDAIWKALDGTKLQPEAAAMLDKVQMVKALHPKRS